MSLYVHCDRCQRVSKDGKQEDGWIRGWEFPVPIGHISRTDQDCVNKQPQDFCSVCHQELRKWFRNETRYVPMEVQSHEQLS